MAGDSSDGRVNRMLKHAAGMAAAAGAFKGLQLVWKQVTGEEPRKVLTTRRPRWAMPSPGHW